jgi:hypothetical protein
MRLSPESEYPAKDTQINKKYTEGLGLKMTTIRKIKCVFSDNAAFVLLRFV